MSDLSAAASGLQAADQQLSVVSENLANVNTVGYKAQQTLFEQMFEQVASGGSAPTATAGGTDPIQEPTGSAVGLALTETNQSEGSITQTGISSNVALSGSGMFLVQTSGGGTAYTRAGDFTTDANGNLVDPNGNRVLGWTAADVTAGNQSPTTLAPITIPINVTEPPKASTTATVSGNLDSSGATSTGGTTTATVPVTLTDAQGNTIDAQLFFSNPTSLAGGGGVQWTVALQPAGGGSTYNGSATGTPLTATLTFPTGGAPTWTTAPSWTVPTTDGSPNVTFALTNADVGTLTSFASASSALGQADGYPVGALQSYSVGANGVITGTFSNGQSSPLGQIAVADFPNLNGLVSTGPNLWGQSANSGTPQIGIAGSGGLGSILPGSVEESNVNLANEFTALISAQENYQANAKVLTVDQGNAQALIQAVQ